MVRAEAFIADQVRSHILNPDSLNYPQILFETKPPARATLYHPIIVESVRSLMLMRSALQPAVLRILAHVSRFHSPPD